MVEVHDEQARESETQTRLRVRDSDSPESPRLYGPERTRLVNIESPRISIIESLYGLTAGGVKKKIEHEQP